MVYPRGFDYTTFPAGVVTRLADDIWRMSALPNPKRLTEELESFRSLMEGFERQAETLIAHMFPAIRIEEMRNWPIAKLLDYAVRAEWLANVLYGLPVRFDLLNDTADTDSKKIDPNALREQGIDPMLLLDPADLRPKMMPDMLITGPGSWRVYSSTNAAKQQEQTEQMSSVDAAKEGREPHLNPEQI